MSQGKRKKTKKTKRGIRRTRQRGNCNDPSLHTHTHTHCHFPSPPPSYTHIPDTHKSYSPILSFTLLSIHEKKRSIASVSAKTIKLVVGEKKKKEKRVMLWQKRNQWWIVYRLCQYSQTLPPHIRQQIPKTEKKINRLLMSVYFTSLREKLCQINTKVIQLPTTIPEDRRDQSPSHECYFTSTVHQLCQTTNRVKQLPIEMPTTISEDQKGV